MAIKGSLKEASLADVCQLLAMGQKTGCLAVTDRSRFGQIYFDQGRLTYARIVNRRDRLGDLLVSNGLITHDQLQEVIDQQSEEPERRLGELLVDREMITKEQLEQCLQRQIEEAVYYLFTWSQGNFYFEAGQQPEEGEVLVSINPESLLLEGARRVDEWSLIEQKIPSLDLLFEIDTGRLDEAEVELTSDQERLVPLLDGSRAVQDLVDETGLVEFDIGKALYGLIQAGFARCIGRSTRRKQERAREAEVDEHRNLGIAFYQTGLLDDAIREFQEVLAMRPDDLSARFHLVLLAVRKGRNQEAVGRLKALLEETGPKFGAFFNLAVALKRMGRAEDALLVLGEAESLRAGAPEVPLLKGVIRLEKGAVSAAVTHLEEYRDRLGDDRTPPPVFYHYAALAAVVSGDLERGGEIADEGLEAHPAAPALLLLVGNIAERKGELDEAEASYRKAVEENASIVQAHKNLGDIAYRRGLHEEAVEHFHRVIKNAPKSGDDVYIKLGNIHYKQKEHKEAVECWQQALDINPDNQVVQNNLEVVDALG